MTNYGFDKTIDVVYITLAVMDDILAYVEKNKEWIFSGIGIIVVNAIWKLPNSMSRWRDGIRKIETPILVLKGCYRVSSIT